MLVKHSDGGHCYTEGMNPDCYGVGLISECKERVKELNKE